MAPHGVHMAPHLDQVIGDLEAHNGLPEPRGLPQYAARKYKLVLLLLLRAPDNLRRCSAGVDSTSGKRLMCEHEV